MDILAKLLQIVGLSAFAAAALFGHWGNARPCVLAAAGGAIALLIGSGLQVWAIVSPLADRLGVGAVQLALEYLTASEAGPIILARLGLAPAAAIAVVVFVTAPRKTLRRPLASAAAALIVAAATYSMVATGHAGAVAGAGEIVVVHCGHLLAAIGWVGAVTALAWLAAEGRAEALEFAARLGAVGWLALFAVLVLATTGPVLASLHGVELAAPAATDYGRTAVAKAALLCAALVPAAYNRWLGLPALRRDAATLPRVRAALFIELGLIAVVLVVAAALTQTPPPH